MSPIHRFFQMFWISTVQPVFLTKYPTQLHFNVAMRPITSLIFLNFLIVVFLILSQGYTQYFPLHCSLNDQLLVCSTCRLPREAKSFPYSTCLYSPNYAYPFHTTGWNSKCQVSHIEQTFFLKFEFEENAFKVLEINMFNVIFYE